MDRRLVYYWSRSPEGKIVTPETTKNHFDKNGVRGILFGEPEYKNPWITGNSKKYFTYLDYDKIYDFEADTFGFIRNTYEGVQKEGGRLLPKFEGLLLAEGYQGYVRHGEIKYFFPAEIHRDYDITPADPEVFWDAISSVRAQYEHSGFDKQLTKYSVGEYERMTLFLSRCGNAGFALDGDNVVSVFSHPVLTPKAFPNLMDVAVRNGGRRVDIFDTYLPRLYSRAGFREVAHMSWNDEYAPIGWDHEKMKMYNGGRPNVIFMVYDPSIRSDLVNSYEEAEMIQRLETVV